MKVDTHAVFSVGISLYLTTQVVQYLASGYKEYVHVFFVNNLNLKFMNKRFTLHATLFIYWVMLAIYFLSNFGGLYNDGYTILDAIWDDYEDYFPYTLQLLSPVFVLSCSIFMLFQDEDKGRNICLILTMIGTLLMSAGIIYPIIDEGWNQWHYWSTDVENVAIYVFPIVSILFCLHIRSVRKYGDDVW